MVALDALLGAVGTFLPLGLAPLSIGRLDGKPEMVELFLWAGTGGWGIATLGLLLTMGLLALLRSVGRLGRWASLAVLVCALGVAGVAGLFLSYTLQGGRTDAGLVLLLFGAAGGVLGTLLALPFGRSR